MKNGAKKKTGGGRHARRKGHQFERDTAIRVRHIFPKARRHLEYQDAEANGVDLVNTGDFKIQCKKLRKYVSVTTIDEIKCNRAFGEVPVVVTEGDNLPAMAILYWDDLLDLIEFWESSRRKNVVKPQGE
jgi:hypothetical protein